MSTDNPPRRTDPHLPERPATVAAEGFSSDGSGRDIFFAAVASTRMPMVVADPRLVDMPIVFVNQAFLEMTGYSEQEVLGRNCRFLQGPETDRAQVALIRSALCQEKELTLELLNYRKDGSTFWNALFMTPVRNAQGELIYYFSSQLDISRRRDAEAALREAQKMEALGQLTGGMAHDFNNLLQVIIGNVDVASLVTRGDDNDKLERALSKIRQAARRSGELTQQLLSFARRQQLQSRVIQLNEPLGALFETGRRALGRQVTFSMALDPNLWNARIDPTQLETAILNLLSNAREAMPKGGRVALSTHNIEVDAQAAALQGLPRSGRFVQVSVQDSGTGIPAEILPRVVDPFFSTKPRSEGSGLGLSMVYGFTKQSGGATVIESELGAGTTVRLYFPVSTEVGPAPLSPRPARSRGGKGRILVVDDHPEITEMAELILAQAGHECACRHSAEQALACLDEGDDFDLLLTDLIMPGGLNGVMLARESQQRRPGLRVLLMTGFADGTPERWGGEHYPMLFKPFAAEDLLRRVHETLESP